jgi:1-acyl-sn-glycerol-3-phosphate acyltransferase
MKPGKIIYYKDPLNDEFSGVGKRRKINVDGSYPYIKNNIFYRAAAFIVYRIVMTPVAFLYCKIKFNMKCVGKEKLKAYRKTGYYIYGNHTQIPGDGYIPNVITFPKKTYIIVNPDNVAAPGTRNFMMMLGALPTPTVLSGFRNFEAAISSRLNEGACIAIYPEAHIWPYYTGIRPFPSLSFRYPAKDGRPVFTFTVTYRRSGSGRPRIITYIDGPFKSSAETPREREKELRDTSHNAMIARAACDNYEFVKYIYRAEDSKE